MVDLLRLLNDRKETRETRAWLTVEKICGLWRCHSAPSLRGLALVSFSFRLPPQTENFIWLFWERPDNKDVCYVNTMRPPDVLATSSVFIYFAPPLAETGLISKKVSYKEYIWPIIPTSLITLTFTARLTAMLKNQVISDTSQYDITGV